MITNVILFAAVLVLVYAGYAFVADYREATGSVWQRLITAAKDSATMLWSYVVMAGASLMGWSVNAADALNLPDVRSFIQGHLSPEMFATTLFVVALVTVAARLRTL